MSKKTKAAELQLDTTTLQQAALVYRAIRNKVRQRILQYIHRNKRIIVSDIYRKLRLEQSVTSAHLAILRGEGLVTAEREGKFIYYSINYSKMEKLHGVAEELLSHSRPQGGTAKADNNKK